MKFTRLFTVLAASLLLAGAASAAITSSLNSGSLGSFGDLTNDDGVTFAPGLLSGSSNPGDLTAYYPGGPLGPGNPAGPNSFLNYNAALNPAANQPFTIEFWANPGSEVTTGAGRAPVFNRVSASPRSGWVFFQRDVNSGWNFAMYNGTGSTLGWDLTGGTAPANAWSHVVATWNGTSAALYVNGVLADNSNTAGLNGVYNASTSAVLSLGAYDNGDNSFLGGVDETAFYNIALTPDRILAHFQAATSLTLDAYTSEVFADHPVEYVQNVPEPGSIALLGLALGGVATIRRRRRAR
jgi:hypothetical protein